MAKREDMVKIPKSILMTASTIDEIEDWLEMQDPAFVEDLRRIRDEEAGKGFTLDELRRRWNIPS